MIEPRVARASQPWAGGHNPFGIARTEIRATQRALALCLLLAALLLPTPFARAATNDLTSAIQRGLFEEEANQNLGAAIQAYQSVASQFDKDRKLAATAIFRLGECYRKQGNTNDAAVQYQRILRDFSDQPTLVTLSRQNLAVLGSAPPATTALVLSDAARQEQKRLLEEEIKLVQRQLDEQKQRVQNGTIAPGDLLPTEREILKLKRQVAALDAGLPISIAANETAAPTSSEAEEVKRIQALIKDSPDLINAKDANGGSTPLHKAAFQGQLIVAEFLLANGADVGAKNGQVQTPLHAAAVSGQKSMVELLLNHQAGVETVDNNGSTPLHLAAEHGYRSVVETLLAHAAAVNAMNKSGSTPLLLASASGFKSVAELLLAHGADINATTSQIGTPLCLAAARGYQPLVELFLSKGARVDAKDKDSRTPLLLAARGNHSGIVELLLAKGADANAEDALGRTPLSYAAEGRSQTTMQVLLAAHANPNAGRLMLPLAEAAYLGNLAALKLLLANGADPNTNSAVTWSINYRGSSPFGGPFTPLFLATSQQHADAVEELLRFKANPNLPVSDKRPLLYYALGDMPTFKALLDGGADPNQSIQGTPLLLQAVMEKNQPVVELLLAHQADVNAINNAANSVGGTPLYLAAAFGYKAIAELLLKAGAVVNAQGKSGDTPLHAAVINRQREMVELLLANKADPNQRNKEGQTPLDLAKSQAQYAQGLPPGARPIGGAAYPGAIPPPGVPIPPALPYQPQAPGTPATAPAQEPKPEAMADLLRRHGAVDDLPQLDRIQVRRTSTGQSSTSLTKGTHDWGQFTLLDLIGVEYQFLAGSPLDGGGVGYSASSFFSKLRGLPFPDLSHLRIRRPTSDPMKWQEHDVDLRPLLDSGDCSKDMLLYWGDVVEIPEANHPLNLIWPGFSRTELANLKKCLTRQVQIVINGQVTNITLGPQILDAGLAPIDPGVSPEPYKAQRSGEPYILARTPFWLQPVLLQSKLVLTSSDLSRVKVTRPLSPAGQAREWIVDCSGQTNPGFWLRDGDKIEVPEKTNAPAAAAAPGPQPSPK